MNWSLPYFTVYLTQECNLTCAYCIQNRQPQSLEFSTIQKTLDFFRDSLTESGCITFYGGEPLLEFETIARTVNFVETNKTLSSKRLHYSISVNGTLLTGKILDFLKAHGFKVNLSHDGTAQDMTRPSSLNSLVQENMDRLIGLPDIEFGTNSVFIPATVKEVYRSARFFIERGVKNCRLSYSIDRPWDSISLAQMREEIRELRKYLLSYYYQNRSIPVNNFRSRLSPGLFQCAAGQDRLALGPDGRVWGCRLFADLCAAKTSPPDLDAYCFGDIRDIAANGATAFSSVVRKYEALSMEGFSSAGRACRECPNLFLCTACPVTAAFSTGVLGGIPAWMCEMKKIWREEVAGFWSEAGPD